MKHVRLSPEEEVTLIHLYADQHGGTDGHPNKKYIRLEEATYHHAADGTRLPDCPGHDRTYTRIANPMYVSPKRGGFPPRLRFAVLSRDGFRCHYCGRGAEYGLELDHVVPVSQGGLTTMANLVTACAECNSGKSDRSLPDFAEATTR